MISSRYEVLLQGHVQKAYEKARFSTMIIALSDSVNLLCMYVQSVLCFRVSRVYSRAILF